VPDHHQHLAGNNDRSSNESGFKLERSSDGQNWQPPVEIGGDTSRYVDDGLARHTPYWYRLSAWNSQGASAPVVLPPTQTGFEPVSYTAGGGSVTPNVEASQTTVYAYDGLNRLIHATASVTGDLVVSGYDESYTYSPTTGNLQLKAGIENFYEDPQHVHAVTRRSDGSHFTYDNNGNMLTRHLPDGAGEKAYTLTYDAENRLVNVSGAATASYLYNGDGQRVAATEGGVTTVFIGSYFEWQVGMEDITQYYYAGSERIAMRQGGSQPHYLLGDHLGSTSVIVDAAGQVIPGGVQLYKPWGEKQSGSGTLPTKYRYTGQWQSEIGIYYYGARWYDSYLNRWTSPDSIVPLATQGTQALDRYAYANNNPIRYVDPSGHDIWDVIGQASTGFVKEFTLRNGGWISPQAQEDLSVKATETTAELAGRIAADAATIMLGIDNMISGATIATGGSVVACGTTLCLGAAATATVGGAIAVVGVAQTAQGAMGLGGNLAQLAGSAGSSGEESRGLWEVTEENSSRVMRHDVFGTFYRSKSDGLWWVKDNASHGGVVWKVYKQTSKGLQWIADADKYGDFFANKHKGPTGYFIPWDQLYAK